MVVTNIRVTLLLIPNKTVAQRYSETNIQSFFRIAQLKSDISAEYYEAISVVAFHCRTPRSKLFHDGCPYQIQNSQWKSMNWFLYDKDLGHEWVDFDTVLKMFESMTIMFEAVNKSCNFFKH